MKITLFELKQLVAKTKYKIKLIWFGSKQIVANTKYQRINLYDLSLNNLLLKQNIKKTNMI